MNEEVPTAGDMSPEAAARFAVDGPENHAAAEGFGAPEKPAWYRALRSSSPNRPIHEIDGIADTLEHWDKYGVRSLEKMAGMDDTEAWVDGLRFVLGGALWAAGVLDGPEASGGKEPPTVGRETDIPAADEPLDNGPGGDVGGEVPR